MLRKDVLRDPVVRQRLSFEGGLVVNRRPIRRMGIPVMHMHHPVVLVPVLLQPLQHPGRHQLRGFPAPVPHIVALVEAGVEPPGAVALRKGGEGYRVHPRPAELHEQAVLRHVVREMPCGPLQPHVRRGPSVPHHSVMYAVQAADHGGPGGQTGGIGTVIVVKPHAFFRNLVHHGRGVPSVPVAAHVIRPQRINVEHQYSHFSLPFFSV